MNPLPTDAYGAPSEPQLTRVVYFDGQRLTASDLNAAASVQREWRWLHNRSLHNWGIGLGFAVSGKRGDRQVTIQPGYAIDCLGREIVLTQTLTKAVPAKGDKTICYLVAAYPDDTALTVVERRNGECDTQGAVRLQEQAAVYWKIEGEQTVADGLEVVLAQATIENCQLAAPLSLAQRRNARSTCQPYVAAGSTPAGATNWELWTSADAGPTPSQSGVEEQEIVYGVKTLVDTASARFGAVPEYQAQLTGPRLLALSGTQGTVFSAVGGQISAALLDGTGVVDGPDRTAFYFYVLMPRGFTPYVNLPVFFSSDQGKAALLTFVRLNWTVTWVGVEG
jgi:hypothetical protein